MRGGSAIVKCQLSMRVHRTVSLAARADMTNVHKSSLDRGIARRSYEAFLPQLSTIGTETTLLGSLVQRRGENPEIVFPMCSGVCVQTCRFPSVSVCVCVCVCGSPNVH